jgi:hypothetical protein
LKMMEELNIPKSSLRRYWHNSLWKSYPVV